MVLLEGGGADAVVVGTCEGDVGGKRAVFGVEGGEVEVCGWGGRKRVSDCSVGGLNDGVG